MLSELYLEYGSTALGILFALSLLLYAALFISHHRRAKLARDILLVVSAIALLCNAVYLYNYFADGSFFSQNSRWMDMVNDHDAGHNFIIGNGYVINMLMYDCVQLPCDGRNRPPLNSLILGLVDTPHQAMHIVIFWFLMCLLLLYILSESILVPALFLVMPIVCSDIASFHYEFLHFTLFLCCYYLYKKGGAWFAIAVSLLVFGSLPISIGLIAAGLLFTKGSKLWMLLPIAMIGVYMMWAGGTGNQRVQGMFAVNQGIQAEVGLGHIQSLQLTLLEKAERYVVTLSFLLLGAPLLFLYLAPLIFERQIIRPDKFIWVSWLVSVMVYAAFSYSPRYEFILLSLLIFIGGKSETIHS